jgi:nitric oxide dioxygenase
MYLKYILCHYPASSLAAAVLTYAEHIDQPERLGGMLQRITNKHSSLAVKAEHYPIVGKYLLGAIQNVLGVAATPEIVEAWGAAYNQLAGIMISMRRRSPARARPPRVAGGISSRSGWNGKSRRVK